MRDDKSLGRPPAKPSRMRRVARGLGRLALLSGVVGGLSAAALGWAYYQYVVVDPGPDFDEAHIRGIIAQESPVYYRDGVTRVGVFFEDEHRQYVPYSELPPAYTVAIVAAEDGHFWSHYGIDPRHIARAMLQNLTSGELVAGGSTLTQQTAKNLYYRPDRSLKSKGVELVNALRLEAHFSKEDILGFYANQFHVSGNGRGLGIASRYFFDKDVADLSFVESAFLAGLVKGPSNYDPFLGDAGRQERSRERAYSRTRYVLRRIVDEPAENLAGPMPIRGDSVSEAEYTKRVLATRAMQVEAQKALDDGFELPFRRGTFRYDSNAVLDEVARRLQEAPFDEVLKNAGIDDPSTAGLVVVTTLDAGIQAEAVYGLWHHLTEVGSMLEGLGAEAYIHPNTRGPHWEPERGLVEHEFRVASVKTQLGTEGKRYLELDLGGNSCLVDREGMVRVALASYRGTKRDKNAKIPAVSVDAFVKAFSPGDVVWASVRTLDDGAGRAVCDLEVRPELQGAVVVLENGEVRAMVGGSDNRNFNRATALRQMGSTWKPLVYHAAMELGWGPTDLLDNGRNGFPFSTTFYWPNPDHEPLPVVSMSWAGVNSENLASIWLLYHLTDRLGDPEVAQLAELLGLARGKNETPEAYRVRIQKEGVLPTPRRVDEALFLQSRHEVASTIGESAHPEDLLPLETLLYGWGVEAERGRVDAKRLPALDRTWLHVKDQIEPCGRQYVLFADAYAHGGLPLPESVPDLKVFADAGQVHVACGVAPEGYFPPDERLLGSVPVEPLEPLGDAEIPEEPPVPSEPVVSATLDPMENMRVGEFHFGTLQQLETGVRRRQLAREAAGDTAADLYSPELLYWHQDFRVLLGMKYVAELARQYGVRTEVKEVLSMPLGASEITLEEAASVYEGVTTGQAWDFPGKGPGILGKSFGTPAAPTLLIAEIQDIDGNIVYRAEPKPRRVAAASTGAMTADILRNVVRFGTGKRALDAITAASADGTSLAVPVGGKTGTTNDYKNVAFIGFAPKASDEGYTVEGAYTVAVYVGYDDNHPMDVGNIRLAGANGALPAWLSTVRGLQAHGDLGVPTVTPGADPFWPLAVPSDLLVAPVDGKTGRVLAPTEVLEPMADTDGSLSPSVPSVLTTRKAPTADVDVRFELSDRPVRVAPRTEEAGENNPPASLWGQTNDGPAEEIP